MHEALPLRPTLWGHVPFSEHVGCVRWKGGGESSLQEQETTQIARMGHDEAKFTSNDPKVQVYYNGGTSSDAGEISRNHAEKSDQIYRSKVVVWRIKSDNLCLPRALATRMWQILLI